MKKKSCFILAILMIMVQLVSAFAVLPAMAETTKSYDIVGTKDEITVDGKANEAIWNSVKSSSAFVHTGGNAIEGFTASFKAVWTPNAEDTSKMDVYIFVTSTEYTVQNSWANNIRFQIETADASHRFWTGQQQLGNVNTGSADRTTTVGEASVPFKLYAVNNIGTSKTATYEFCYTMPKSDTIKFDILLNACESASNKNESGYSWVSMTGTAIASANLGGEGKILPIPEYDFDRITESMTIDGKANESFWGSASSVEFVNDTTNDRAVSFKAGWSPCDGGENMKVYFLISVKGYKEYNYLNSVQVQLEDENGSQRIWSGAGYNINSLHENTRKDVPVIDYTNNNNVAYQAAGVRVLNGTSVYEYAFTMKKTETIRFDILASFFGGAIYSFAGIEAVGASVIPTGIGNVVDYKFNDLNIVTTPGASIRVDTENKDKSGIRFETKVDAAVVAALKDAGATITTGTLVLPTATLTNNGIPDADFTIAKLEEAQLRSGIDYYNIINVGNEWVDGMDGTWFGTVFDVKNLTRQFSAVGYVTVELDGETTTLYGGYVSTNSRSIKDVATILLEGEEVGDGGSWNSEQEAILKNFSLAGTDTN